MKNELNVEIGGRVREQRKLMGMTREQFAEKLDISERFLTDIELGNRGMSFKTLINLCNTLSVSSDYILMGKTDNNKAPESKITRLASQIDDKHIPYIEEMLLSMVKMLYAENQIKNLMINENMMEEINKK